MLCVCVCVCVCVGLQSESRADAPINQEYQHSVVRILTALQVRESHPDLSILGIASGFGSFGFTQARTSEHLPANILGNHHINTFGANIQKLSIENNNRHQHQDQHNPCSLQASVKHHQIKSLLALVQHKSKALHDDLKRGHGCVRACVRACVRVCACQRLEARGC